MLTHAAPASSQVPFLFAQRIRVHCENTPQRLKVFDATKTCYLLRRSEQIGMFRNCFTRIFIAHPRDATCSAGAGALCLCVRCDDGKRRYGIALYATRYRAYYVSALNH